MRPAVIPESAANQRKQFAAAYAVLQTAIAARAFPGASFGVLHRNSIVALDGVGHFIYPGENLAQQNERDSSAAPDASLTDPRGEAADPALAPPAAAVTPFTVYDLASLTKVVATTAAAMLLYDRGILDLNEPVGDILPGFVVGMETGSGKGRVTLRMLLAHCSGLPGYARLFESHTTPPQLLRACLRLPLEAHPGARMEYSDPGFILLGTAIDVLSGQTLASLCAREIFEPMGMTRTRFCPPPDWRDAIPPTERDATFRKRVIQGEVHDENCFVLGGAAGHAGLFSNARDILRYAECILGGGRTAPDRRSESEVQFDIRASETPGAAFSPSTAAEVPASHLPRQQLYGAPLFRRESVELFATRQPSPPGTSRALGWDTPTQPSTSGQYFSSSSIGHLGFTGTSLWIDRERELAVVLLTNRTWPDREHLAASKESFREMRGLFHDAISQCL